jgi:hypothetical protein
VTALAHVIVTEGLDDEKFAQRTLRCRIVQKMEKFVASPQIHLKQSQKLPVSMPKLVKSCCRLVCDRR